MWSTGVLKMLPSTEAHACRHVRGRGSGWRRLVAPVVAPAAGSAPIAAAAATATAAAAAAISTATATATATTATTTTTTKTAAAAAAAFVTVVPAAEASAAAAAATTSAAAIAATTAAAERLEKIRNVATGLDEHVVEGAGDVGVLLVDESGGTALRVVGEGGSEMRGEGGRGVGLTTLPARPVRPMR